MGKGDKKSKRGKIILGSFGVRRHRKSKHVAPAAAPVKVAVVTEKHKVAKAVAKPEKAKIETAEVIKAEVMAETHTEHKVAAKAKPKAAVKAEPKTVAKAAPKAAAKAEPKAEPKKTAKAEPKTAKKAAPKKKE